MEYNKEKVAAFRKKALSGEMYDSMDMDFINWQHEVVQKVFEYNQTPETEDGIEKRETLLREMLGTYGENLYIIPPISANCGLANVHVGKDVVINFNANFVDDGEIFIGDDTMIGPNVSIVTAQHPLSPALRKPKLQWNKPVHIGKNVWIGAGAIIMPGVTLGDNVVVGSGSVVTKDVDADTIVVGNPARPLRRITPEDDYHYDKTKDVPQEFIEKYVL